MASNQIAKMFNSLAAMSPELNLALLNLNFDITLFKSEPPREYSGLGQVLSKKRRAAAEDGEEHIIARKLGRLFHNFLPDVPALLSAYGERASRIAGSSNAETTANRSAGVFADYTGLDGTSIWAGATSSKEGLCLHLLACMLARVWQAPQAISIWSEIIEQRKADLALLSPNDPLHLSDAAAARMDLTREELAKWDASARSWLCIADEAMKREQTQLLLLVDKTKLPIDVSPGVYKSVIGAWKKAMKAIDKIIEGMAYAIEDGAVVLGLASWHLFPDMHVLGLKQNQDVKQDDPVIPRAGVLTFGIEGSSRCEDNTEIDLDEQDEVDDGVRWSLPLSNLRYYGEPVVSKCSMGSSTLRLRLQEFSLVVLGSFISRWQVDSYDVVSAATLISSIWEFLCTIAKANPVSSPLPDSLDSGLPDHDVQSFPSVNSWFKLLAEAADDLLSADGLEREAKERLVERGCRRYHEFLACFKFCTRRVLSFFLRDYIKKAKLEHEDVIIRYRHRHLLSWIAEDHKVGKRVAPIGIDLDSVRLPQSALAEALTPEPTVCLPENVQTSLEDEQSNASSPVFNDEQSDARFDDWFSTNLQSSIVADDFGNYFGSRCKKRIIEYDDVQQKTKRRRTTGGQIPDRNIDRGFAEYFEFASAVPLSHGLSQRAGAHHSSGHVRWVELSSDNGKRVKELQVRGEDVKYFDLKDVIEFDNENFSWARDDTGETTMDGYVLMFGCHDIGAVYRKTTMEPLVQEDLDICDVRSAFDAHAVDPKKFLRHLSYLEVPEEMRHRREPSMLVHSLKGIAAAANLYRLMPEATITARTFMTGMDCMEWVPIDVLPQPPNLKKMTSEDNKNKPESKDMFGLTSHGHLERLKASTLNRTQAFACIAMFENGSLIIDPRGLGDVMALSAANSIYVAMPLLCDPMEQPLDWEVKHFVGNIGRPGISFLVPPPALKVKKQARDDLVHHRPFDGQFNDFFTSTSLHLSFTRSVVPIDVNLEGAQDTEAYFRQTVVHLHGPGGDWVADLDILGALKNQQLFRRLSESNLTPCTHSVSRRSTPGCVLKSIDNWDEFLDRPRVPGVVRATGNWLARLAAATLNVQRGFPVLVLPQQECAAGDTNVGMPAAKSEEKLCWACILSHFIDGNTKHGWRSNGVVQNSFNAENLPFFIA